MATIKRRGNKYQVQVRKKGALSRTKTFLYLADAKRWARAVESEIDARLYPSTNHRYPTFGHVAEAYRDRIVPMMKSAAREADRLRLMCDRVGHMASDDFSSEFLSGYRDKRIQAVSPQTVKHEIGLIRRVLKFGLQELGLDLARGIPVVRLPQLPPGRARRLQVGELERLSCELPSLVFIIVELAIETGMRRSELLSITPNDLDWDRRLVTLSETKNSESRAVPLSNRAFHILRDLGSNNLPLPIAPDSVSRAFSRACKRCGISDLRFHDLRHEAITRFFERGLSVPEVASISGHKDYRMLARYTHLRVESFWW